MHRDEPAGLSDPERIAPSDTKREWVPPSLQPLPPLKDLTLTSDPIFGNESVFP